jgi:acetolactate synthase-1/2/3 large subunit
MNGAENLLSTLIASGVEVCFANPGTSEMQLVSAIGNSTGMRAVLCLFEGVAAGAADGYARMAYKTEQICTGGSSQPQKGSRTVGCDNQKIV